MPPEPDPYPYDSADYYDEPDYDDYSDDDDPESCGLINYHSYRPTPMFMGEGPRFMGFELETCASRAKGIEGSASTVLDAWGDIAYLKEDGSISYGFEIVTHPMSYTWAMENFNWAALDMFKREGIGPDNTTGLHIHVSRDAFTPTHAYKWMKFIYRNQREVEAIARRRGTQWAEFMDEHRRSHAAIVKGKDMYYDRHTRSHQYVYQGRYAAVNTTNTDTFEVRVFASTIDQQELQAALGLVDASAAYSAEIDAYAIHHRDAWSWSAFSKWVDEREQYAPLSREMRKLNVHANVRA